MGCSTYTFMLDLHSKKGQLSLPVTQGDTNRELRISFSDGVKPYVLETGSVAMMSIVRPTGTEVQEFCQIEDDGARVVYPFSQYTCAVAGLHTCEVVLINSKGKQIASPRFSIDAAPKLVDGNDVEIPDEDITAIDAIYQNEALRQAAEAEREEAEAAREANTTAAIAEINKVKTSIETMRDNGDFDGDDGVSPVVGIVTTSDGYEITVTDKAGAKTFHIYNGIAGADGAAGISAFHEWNGTTLTMHSAAGTSSADLKGEKGNKGDRGDGIDIVKSFSSVAEMLSGQATDGVPIGKFVVISTGNVDDEENARLYVKTETGYMYLTDLSGAQGIRGEKGDQGERGPQGIQGERGPQGIQGVQGEKGYTPQKRVDYFTDKDISDIATEAAAKVDLKDINTAIDNLDDAKVPIINTIDGVMQPNISGKTNWNLWDTFVYAYSPNVKENGKLKFDGSPKLWKMSSGWNPDNKNSTEGLTIVLRTVYGTIAAADPIGNNDVVTKGYFDDAIGDISAALDELHTYAQSLTNGG